MGLGDSALLWIGFLSLKPVLAMSDVCSLVDTDQELHRNYKTGESICCSRIVCPPGHEAVICNRMDANSTSCRLCPEGTYQSEETNSADMVHCASKRSCSIGQRVLYLRSKTRDSVCTCDKQDGFCNPGGVKENPRSCRRKKCPKGFQPTYTCECEPCPEGTFKNTAGPHPCSRLKRRCTDVQTVPGVEANSPNCSGKAVVVSVELVISTVTEGSAAKPGIPNDDNSVGTTGVTAPTYKSDSGVNPVSYTMLRSNESSLLDKDNLRNGELVLTFGLVFLMVVSIVSVHLIQWWLSKKKKVPTATLR